MDNLYTRNQSCQYEKIFPNSIVVPVLADGRAVPIPTKKKIGFETGRVPTVVYSPDAAAASSMSLYQQSEWLSRNFVPKTENNGYDIIITVGPSAILGSILCGRRRTGSNECGGTAPVRARNSWALRCGAGQLRRANGDGCDNYNDEDDDNNTVNNNNYGGGGA